MSSLLVEVLAISGFDKPLTYLPPAQGHPLRVGQLVSIPLGRRKTLGVVSALNVEASLAPDKLKRIYEVLYEAPMMTADTLALAHWMGHYYAAGRESIFEAMIPAPVRKGVEVKTQRLLRVARKLDTQELETLNRRAPKQAALYGYLLGQSAPVDRAEVLKQLNMSAAACDGLVAKGIVEDASQTKPRIAYSDDLAGAEQVVHEPVTLNDEQQAAAQSMIGSVDTGAFATHLLHGVTGSGKTEVYLRVIEHVLKQGGGVIFLVPEVALTPQTVGRMRSRLADMNTQTVVWHSMLSAGERFDGWMALARGDARVVVGARSAIFAPVHNLKLIVVDEEHEPAYKQGETPRYHGRDVAVYRAMLAKATCVLGSATPSLESLYNVHVNRYTLNRLEKRIDDRKLPRIRLIDMRSEMLRTKAVSSISRELGSALMDRFEKREQSILFLNRRGYSSSMLCPDCGYVAMSPESSVALTYHRSEEKLKCHLTGYEEPAPEQCPACGSQKIRWRGFGTQKVEEVLQKILPHANIVRMDADTMAKKNLFRSVLSDFRKGTIDVLLGTQMIAKGLDFPNVTLVGLIDADLSLHMPDFRAAERTFQLLVQVAGRAGRGDTEGEVYVQTFLPSSAPIQFARRQDFDGFLEAELEQRKEFNYPPYRRIVRHVFRSRNEQKLIFYAEKWVDAVEEALGDELEIRGPAPAPLEKIKGFYRYHVWYFTHRVYRIMPQMMELRERFQMDKEVIDVFDVDPVDMG